MLKRVDRILVAVRDRVQAEEPYVEILGAESVRDDMCHLLNAHRRVLSAGESEIELLEPAGDGPVADHIAQYKEGLFAAGFAVDNVEAVASRLRERGVVIGEEENRILIGPDQTAGLRIVISGDRPRDPAKVIRFFYEVTNVIGNWQQASARYTDLFSLDPSRFFQIESDAYGYSGELLLFDPPNRLDRIELSQPTELGKTMGRFWKQRGDSLYMCYAEADDVSEIAARLQQRKAPWSGGPPGAGNEMTGLFIHPPALNGVLMGVSRKDVAWIWSGRPDLVAS